MQWTKNPILITILRLQNSRRKFLCFQLVVPGHGEFLTFDELKDDLVFIEDSKKTFAGKESAFDIFKKTYNESDLETALKTLLKMNAQDQKYFVLHPEIDQYAYFMMLDNKLDEALAIFKVLADLFPNSDIAFDSLGEVYMRKENIEMAITSFKKSLELNPDNRNASAKLKALQKKISLNFFSVFFSSKNKRGFPWR